MSLPIHFKVVRFKNLFSYGNNFTEVRLDKPGLKLIQGNSGAGKSTLLDALLIGLFGKPYKKVNQSGITNSVNGKGCLVEIEFDVGADSFLVRRGIAPKVFEIERNGEAIDQDAKATDLQKKLEAQILGGITYNTFTQTSVIGSANYTPFMKLGAGERRVLVEGLLNLSIFTTASEVAKKRAQVVDKGIQSLTSDLRVHQATVQEKRRSLNMLYEQKRQAESSNKGLIAEKHAEKAHLADQGEALTEQIKVCRDEVLALEKAMSQEDFDLKTQEGRDMAHKVGQLKEKVALWRQGKCPTCGQELADDPAVFSVSDAEHEIENINSVLAELRDLLVKDKGLRQQNADLMQKGKALTQQLESIARTSERIDADIARLELEDKKTAVSVDFDALNAEIDGLDQTVASVEASIESEVKVLKRLRVCVAMLKDEGVKAKIIRVFIPLMNQIINEYLAEFEMDVYFEFDEGFNETIKGRGRDDFVYENLSEGEKRRLDLAVLLTWLKVAEQKNSLNSNLIVADELLDGSLDTTGVANLIRLLQIQVEESGRSIFIISHRSDLKEDEAFKDIYQVTKEGSFSEMALLNQ